MTFDETSGDLRALGERLYYLIRQLDNQTRIYCSGGFYHASSASGNWVDLRFIGERARKYPRNSVHLSARRHDDFFEDHHVKEGNNYHHLGSVDLSVQPNNLGELGSAENFIRLAFSLYGR